MRLEEGGEVAGGQPALEAAIGAPDTREDVFPRHRRIEIRHAIQHGRLDDVAAEAEGGAAADMGPLTEHEIGPERGQIALRTPRCR